MNRKNTGGQNWPLTSPQENPTVIAGGAARFDLNDVPDRSPTGPLANYIPALLLTIFGTMNFAAEAGDPIAWYDIPRLLINSIEVRNAWHGTPLAAVNLTGPNIRLIEFVGNGYSYGDTATAEIAGDNAFALQVALPLSAGQDSLINETSQLALLYQPASVQIQMQPAAVLDAASEGTTCDNMSLRCSAELDPRAELVLGAGVEWIMHRAVASPAGFEIQVKGFGRETNLTGVQPKAGVLALMELGNGYGLGGVLPPNAINNIAFNWRGQAYSSDVISYLNGIRRQLPNFRTLFTPTAGGTTPVDRAGFPYAPSSGGAAYSSLSTQLMLWPWVLAGDKCRLTDVETADRDETYHLGLTGDTYDTGDHLILAQYVKQWTIDKRAQWETKVRAGGDSSLAAHVLGSRLAGASLKQREPLDKHQIDGDLRAFLPWQLA
jgi:hypothetical protein